MGSAWFCDVLPTLCSNLNRHLPLFPQPSSRTLVIKTSESSSLMADALDRGVLCVFLLMSLRPKAVALVAWVAWVVWVGCVLGRWVLQISKAK